MPRRSLPWRRASTTHASLAAVEAADVSKRFRPIERVQGCSTRRRERRTVNRVTPNGESLRTVDLPDTTGLSGAHLRTTEWRGSRPGGAQLARVAQASAGAPRPKELRASGRGAAGYAAKGERPCVYRCCPG